MSSIFENLKLKLRNELLAPPSTDRTSNIRSLLEAGAEPDWFEMRMICDQDDPELLKLFLEFPHICQLITEDICAYVFKNSNIANCEVMYDMLEEILYSLQQENMAG